MITSAIFEKPGEALQLQSFQMPELKPDQILVRVEACTICGSDLHTYRGLRKEKTPTILGHEAIGFVEKTIGDSLAFDGTKLEVGDRITWSVCANCGDCDRCLGSLPQKCRGLKKFGHEQVLDQGPFFGGLSNYVVLPGSTPIFKISQDFPAEVICPANCATATVLACMEKTGNVFGKKALILGAGLLGLTATAYCKANGAASVDVLDREPSRLNLAQRFGADRILPAEQGWETSANEYDLIVDLAGSVETIQKAMTRLAMGGVFVIGGTVMPCDDLVFNPERLLRNLHSIVGVHNYRPDHLALAIRFLEQHVDNYPFKELVAKSFPLAKINEAFDFALTERPIRVMVKP